MAAADQVTFEDDQENDESSAESEGSDPGNDSDLDPSYSILEDTKANFSNLSIRKKSKSRVGNDLNVGVDENEEEIVQQIIEAGQVEKLKVEQCKLYLRKNGLRLTGNKCTLIQRIKEHLEISNGEGEKKYPVSSFVLNCKGDACTGDVVMFEQNVYEMFNLASRSATGPPCGKRIVAGRIVKESYGAGKQQHTFTIEVLWSKGEKPVSPLHQLLIKGRNLYRLKTLRQRWDDEGERHKVLMEKHSRGSLARSDRDIRIQGKEKRKMLKANRMSVNEDPKGIQSQMNFKAPEKVGMLFQQPDLCVDTNKMVIRPQRPAVQPQRIGLIVDSRKPAAAQSQVSVGPRNLALQPQFAFSSGNLPSQFQALKVEMQNNDQKQLPQDPVKCSVVMEMQHPLDDVISHAERTSHRQPNLDMSSHQSATHKYPNTDRMSSFSERTNHIQPNFSMSSHQSPPYKYRNTNQINGLPKRTSHRQPLKGINHFRPMSPPHRHGHMKQQLCQYYAQGRCYFGDNCKFLHERR